MKNTGLVIVQQKKVKEGATVEDAIALFSESMLYKEGIQHEIIKLSASWVRKSGGLNPTQC